MKILDLEVAVKLESIALSNYYWTHNLYLDREYDGKPPKDMLKYSIALRNELNKRPVPDEYQHVYAEMNIHWNAYRFIYDKFNYVDNEYVQA